jgi:anti-anti-sigma factor
VRFSVDQSGDVRRIALDGRLDADGVAAIETDFQEAAAESPNLIVDMTDVPFVASLGIRMLVNAAKAQEHLGGKMVLAGIDEMTQTILHTTGINFLIPWFATLEEAQSQF